MTNEAMTSRQAIDFITMKLVRTLGQEGRKIDECFDDDAFVNILISIVCSFVLTIADGISHEVSDERGKLISKDALLDSIFRTILAENAKNKMN